MLSRASICSRRKYLATLRMLGRLDAFLSLPTVAQISEKRGVSALRLEPELVLLYTLIVLSIPYWFGSLCGSTLSLLAVYWPYLPLPPYLYLPFFYLLFLLVGLVPGFSGHRLVQDCQCLPSSCLHFARVPSALAHSLFVIRWSLL